MFNEKMTEASASVCLILAYVSSSLITSGWSFSRVDNISFKKCHFWQGKRQLQSKTNQYSLTDKSTNHVQSQTYLLPAKGQSPQFSCNENSARFYHIIFISFFIFARDIDIVRTDNSDWLRSLDIPFSCVLVAWLLQLLHYISKIQKRWKILLHQKWNKIKLR